MARFSAVIICHNNADTIGQACASVAWADELVVVDSGSTDQTPAIARRYTDRVVSESWRGHIRQRAFAAELCRNDWILLVDSDEECSPELATELAALDDATLARRDLLLVRRRNYLLGRPVRAWWPDWQSRVVHRHRCGWGEHILHDRRTASSPDRVGRLRGWLTHKRHSAQGFDDYFGGRRLDQRLIPVAQQEYRNGKRCRPWDLALRPTLAFLKFYILRRGFLDGTFGLLIAQKAAVSTQLRYAALWAVQNGVVPASDQTLAR